MVENFTRCPTFFLIYMNNTLPNLHKTVFCKRCLQNKCLTLKAKLPILLEFILFALNSLVRYDYSKKQILNYCYYGNNYFWLILNSYKSLEMDFFNLPYHVSSKLVELTVSYKLIRNFPEITFLDSREP